MNIAVLFGEIAYISRSNIIDGILDSAKKDNSNVTLFTCEGFLFHELKSYITGEYTIFKLPAFENFDGLIIDINSIQDKQTQDYLIDNINHFNIPCVSFDGSTKFGNQISFDNEIGFRKLINHIIEFHNITDIHYISGPLGNHDAIERLAIFKSVLAEHGLNISENDIYEGDFDYGSGKDAARLYLQNTKKLPKAFVAANDLMAIGLIEELKNNGIRIPEDVIVTGYDNCELAYYTIPRLTTVDRNEYKAGVIAYRELLKNIDESKECGYIKIEGRPIISESCGCSHCNVIISPNNDERTNANISLSDEKDSKSEDIISIPKLSKSLIETRMHMDQSLDLIKGLNIELSCIDSLDSFERSLEKYVEKIGMDYFYFCQCGSRESYYDELEILASGKRVRRNMTTYQDTVWCPIAYEKGEWNSYPKYSSRLLFPPYSKYAKEGTYYIVMPVHQEDICIGYSIIGNFDKSLSGRVLQHLILGIDTALGNIRRYDIMTSMLAKINQKWQYDELTGLYNRSGMKNNVQNLINKAIDEDQGIAVLFFDLDGLKAVNDSMGHEAGDEYIKKMADVLKTSTSDNDIAIRYGGDEYIVVSKQASWKKSLELLNHIEANVIKPLSVSSGCVFGYITQADELNTLIEDADKKMYSFKKRKKRER